MKRNGNKLLLLSPVRHERRVVNASIYNISVIRQNPLLRVRQQSDCYECNKQSNHTNLPPNLLVLRLDLYYITTKHKEQLLCNRTTLTLKS